MALKRKRIERGPTPRVFGHKTIDIPPDWVFTISQPDYGSIKFDLTYLQRGNRNQLAQHMRDALWNTRHESSVASLETYDVALKKFWKFLDHEENRGRSIARLNQVDRSCIDNFISWLELQTVPSTHKNAGAKISRSANRTTYCAIKSLLINRQKYYSPDVDNNLNFPSTPFPRANISQNSSQSYSESENKNILAAIGSDLKRFHAGRAVDLTPLQILTVHILAIAAATGINLQPILGLTRESITQHPLGDREILSTRKRRGWTTHATSLRKSDANREPVESDFPVPTSVGDHFRSACEYTALLAKEASTELSPFVFLWKAIKGPQKGELVLLGHKQVKTGIRDFVGRHKLTGSNGQPLCVSFSRFRPTFASNLYRRSRDIRLVSSALGHASVETTSRHYIHPAIEMERDHALVVEEMVSAFSRHVISGKIVLAADGGVPKQQVVGLVKKGYNTALAHCRNPFRDDETICKKFLTCFRCPNMLILEDDLWRLFSFYYRLLSEKAKFRADHWVKTFGPIIRRIDQDIAPLFPEVIVTAAREKARTNPHPSWRSPT